MIDMYIVRRFKSNQRLASIFFLLELIVSIAKVLIFIGAHRLEYALMFQEH